MAINFLEMLTCVSSPSIVAEFSDLMSQEQGFRDACTEVGGINDLVLSYILLVLSIEEANHLDCGRLNIQELDSPSGKNS